MMGSLQWRCTDNGQGKKNALGGAGVRELLSTAPSICPLPEHRQLADTRGVMRQVDWGEGGGGGTGTTASRVPADLATGSLGFVFRRVWIPKRLLQYGNYH